MQQRLTEVNHPDHQIIVYPDLGHSFARSNQWIDSHGQWKNMYFRMCLNGSHLPLGVSMQINK
jgi:hypothetical protein